MKVLSGFCIKLPFVGLVKLLIESVFPSISLSFVKTLKVVRLFSFKETISSTATGASLIELTVIFTVAVSKLPCPSEIV